MSFGRAAGPAMAARLFGGAPGPRLALLRAAWAAVVGREIARRSEVVSLDRRILNVRVEDAGWQRVLHRMEREILQRIRDVAGDLAPSRLGFVQGPVKPSAEVAPNPPAPQAASGHAPPSLRAAAEAIEDPDLRQAFLHAATIYLEKKGHA